MATVTGLREHLKAYDLRGALTLCRAAGRAATARDRAREAIEVVARRPSVAAESEALALVETGRAALELGDLVETWAAIEPAVKLAEAAAPGVGGDEALATGSPPTTTRRSSSTSPRPNRTRLIAPDSAPQECGVTTGAGSP